MPLGRPLVGRRQRQHARLRESWTGNHQSYRQAGRGEAAWDRDRWYPVHVELAGILEFGIARLVALFPLQRGIDLPRSAPARWQHHDIEVREGIVDGPPEQL